MPSPQVADDCLHRLFDLRNTCFRTSIAGFSNAYYAQYTYASQFLYEKIYAIAEHSGVHPYLFAGSLVGYVRNEAMPPWIDDIDIVIVDEYIDRFEAVTLPYLNRAGFNCFPPIDYNGGGYHVIGLQTSDMRESSIHYDDGIAIRVPWAQADFFYTVFKDNVARNPAGWGLYHARNIPRSWITPGTQVSFGGWQVRVFSEYRKDILHEYGDVLNNVVIASHGKTFLESYNTPWPTITAAIDSYTRTAQLLPPSVAEADVDRFAPKDGATFEPPANSTFAAIANGILTRDCSVVRLTDPVHIFWTLDLKRIFPRLIIEVEVHDAVSAARANHLRHAIDSVFYSNVIARQCSEEQFFYLNLNHSMSG